jgi:hypothetical protein
MISSSKVQTGEFFCPTQFINQLLDDGHGKAILDCDEVQVTIVYAESSRQVFLLNKQNW